MIDLSVNCLKLRARLTEHGCKNNQRIRVCCLDCEKRDENIKYVGLLSDFVREPKVSRRSSTKDERSHDKRKVEGSIPSGGTKYNARKAAAPPGLIRQAPELDSRPRYQKIAPTPLPAPVSTLQAARDMRTTGASCKNCNHPINGHHSHCKPCERAMKAPDREEALKEVRLARKNGKIRKGRPIDPLGIHSGGRKAA